MELTGIHHVSVFTADPVRNLAFYTQALGLRLVKKTVNQDNTSSYHLFYGDEQGSPGTGLTFFDIPHAAATHPGVNSISTVSLRVADDADLQFWQERLDSLGIEHSAVVRRGGRKSLSFRDPDGLRLTLVSDQNDPEGVPGGTPWAKSIVPPAHGIRGLGPVTLTVRDLSLTAHALVDVLGFREVGAYAGASPGQADVVVFATGAGGTGAEVHVEERPDLPREKLGRGGVHHVALRVPDDEAYAAWYERLEAAGFHTSGLINRYYFQSIYFRDRNRILFELATDGPGFLADEELAHLGETLALPPWLASERQAIEAQLRPLKV